MHGHLVRVGAAAAATAAGKGTLLRPRSHAGNHVGMFIQDDDKKCTRNVLQIQILCSSPRGKRAASVWTVSCSCSAHGPCIIDPCLFRPMVVTKQCLMVLSTAVFTTSASNTRSLNDELTPISSSPHLCCCVLHIAIDVHLQGLFRASLSPQCRALISSSCSRHKQLQSTCAAIRRRRRINNSSMAILNF
jgi:hypothetical protein